MFMIESSTGARFVPSRQTGDGGSGTGHADHRRTPSGGVEGTGFTASDFELMKGAFRVCVIAEVGMDGK